MWGCQGGKLQGRWAFGVVGRLEGWLLPVLHFMDITFLPYLNISIYLSILIHPFLWIHLSCVFFILEQGQLCPKHKNNCENWIRYFVNIYGQIDVRILLIHRVAVLLKKEFFFYKICMNLDNFLYVKKNWQAVGPASRGCPNTVQGLLYTLTVQ